MGRGSSGHLELQAAEGPQNSGQSLPHSETLLAFGARLYLPLLLEPQKLELQPALVKATSPGLSLHC